MEVTTIIGIVVAVIIILVGLRMLLRKPNDAAPSLESELHVNSECQQPIIPRHVRDQLTLDDVVPTTSGRVEPNLDKISSIEVADVVANPINSVETAPEKDQPIAEVVEPAVQEQTVETPATSDTSASLDKAQNNDKVEETLQEQTVKAESEKKTEPEFSLNPNIEAAEILDFEGESNILDVHLHEQQLNDDASILANAEQIIALNLYPNPRRALSGDKTLKVLLKYGLRFGEMSCFHRYENINEPSPLMFSVLRITDEGPAGFDLETLSTEQVNGLAFFLALPHTNVQKGFDTMASVAGLIAREIDGTVYDENNLEFTPQLKEHWRHQAIDYRSKQEA
ncbi:cell division protein ZipA C-terminal FtsZ-binding domain-containing protein [Acinetobacter stercoris]|uniref:Cell division protein ZipA n=1 Tax=Acinetobacter stercoris TaxID=2126983 RepID=A0A2U3MYN1_9GAMM|nr:cell division protein ZipA C-terminal FtsZ-binding domain-containing protein [Acinetobacter stercoris]SPL70537.1 Cell division protein ZipA [Acinetobacter stercoris]